MYLRDNLHLIILDLVDLIIVSRFYSIFDSYCSDRIREIGTGIKTRRDILLLCFSYIFMIMMVDNDRRDITGKWEIPWMPLLGLCSFGNSSDIHPRKSFVEARLHRFLRRVYLIYARCSQVTSNLATTTTHMLHASFCRCMFPDKGTNSLAFAHIIRIRVYLLHSFTYMNLQH